MSRRTFFRKLSYFMLPLVALYALPLAVLVRSYEIAPVSIIAARHSRDRATAVYGPAYGNPDKGYKLASIAAHEASIVAVGTSRIMQFRSDFFTDGEREFYNAGGVVSRLFDYRALFRKLRGQRARRAIVNFDPWMFNEAWPDFGPDPGVMREYEMDYSTLDVIQRSLRVYPDTVSGKLDLGLLFSARDGFGVNGITHGNGFRRDGSYRYEDFLRNPKSSADYEFKDTLERIRSCTRRFERGDGASLRALAELDALATQWERDGFEIVAFLPPYAPTVVRAMRASGAHAWVFAVTDAVRGIFERHHVPFVDLTTCGEIGCVDADFVDGFHGGTILYARFAIALSTLTPWLAAAVDRPGLERRLEAHGMVWELEDP